MHQSRAQALACGLGFFSIGLGIAELAAPRLVANLAGARVSPSMIRLYGMREIATGLGLRLQVIAVDQRGRAVARIALPRQDEPEQPVDPSARA